MPNDEPDPWIELTEDLSDPAEGSDGLVCACGGLLTSRAQAREHAAHWDDPAYAEGWRRRIEEATGDAR